LATNLATAEAMLKAVERGDLDWRYLVNPPKEQND
jgi:methylglyoxal synthase